MKDEAGKADPFWERSPRKSVTGPLGDARFLKLRQPDVNRRIKITEQALAGVERLELTTPGFGDRCSSQLSYTPNAPRI
jgi:hypothetical protein